LLGSAFLSARPELLGKRPDGRRAAAAALALVPYTLFLLAFHAVLDRRDRRRTSAEVVPGIWLGGYLGRHAPPAAVDLVIDVASELPRAPGTRGLDYLALPCLNRRTPSTAQTRRVVDRAAAHRGAVLVYCGAGKGRSAAVVVAVLMARGQAATVAEAEALIRRVKPAVGLHPGQRRLVESLTPARAAERGSRAASGTPR
jgi:protein-tyrosine phosphatase